MSCPIGPKGEDTAWHGIVLDSPDLSTSILSVAFLLSYRRMDWPEVASLLRKVGDDSLHSCGLV